MAARVSPPRLSLLLAGALLIVATVLAARPGEAHAHPLGNFTINRYTRIEVAPDAVRLYYVLDMAEVPAFQEIRVIDSNRNQTIDAPEEKAYLDARVDEIGRNLRVSLDGSPIATNFASAVLTFPPGQGGLATLRIEARFESRVEAGAGRPHTLAYEDRNYPDRLGWKEVVARPLEGVAFESSTVPPTDRSDELRAYPEGGLDSPLDVTKASVVFRSAPAAGGTSPSATAGPATAASAGSDVLAPATGAGRATAAARSADPLARLLRRDRLTPAVVALALFAALGIGGFHALTPGHGKTIMAAYLIGTQGRAHHAVMLGATVAVSHTIGVLALGGLAVYAANVIAPDQVYPYLGLAAGAIVFAIGAWMVYTRIVRRAGGAHTHAAGHAHGHDHSLEHGHQHDDSHEHADVHAQSHGQAHAQRNKAPRTGVTWRTLLAIGLADGAVPSASALIVWLAAISIGRVEFGLVMVAAFGIGMAAALTAVGFILVRGRTVFENRFAGRSAVAARLNRALPWLTALFVVGAGVFLMVRAAGQAGLF